MPSVAEPGSLCGAPTILDLVEGRSVINGPRLPGSQEAPVKPVRSLCTALVIGMVTLTAACGGDDDKTGAPSGAQAVTVQAANGKVTIPARPKRIVSLSPTHT